MKATKKKLMNLGYSTMSCVVIKVSLCLFHAKERAVFTLQRITERYSLSFIPLCFGLVAKKNIYIQCFDSSYLTANFVLRVEI